MIEMGGIARTYSVHPGLPAALTLNRGLDADPMEGFTCGISRVALTHVSSVCSAVTQSMNAGVSLSLRLDYHAVPPTRKAAGCLDCLG